LVTALGGCGVDDTTGADGVEAADDQAAASAAGDEADAIALAGDEVPQADGAEAPTVAESWYHGEVLLEYHYPNPAALSSYEAAICSQRGYHSALFPHTNATPFKVLNGCGTRVWVYQWLNHTGAQRCISPGAAVNLSGHYKSFLLTANPRHC
jgi:hypothetical protein